MIPCTRNALECSYYMKKVWQEVLDMNMDSMYRLTYGLFVLSAHKDGKDNGCIINTAGQVTAEPNRISVTVNQSNLTCEMIADTGVLNLSVLSENADFELFRRFGFQSGRDADKFEGFDAYECSANGLLYVTQGTNAYISAKVVQSVDLGTHTMFLADVTDMDVLSEERSATYEYYQREIKPAPKPPVKEETLWRCKVCGYEYREEELPEDFICPWCKHPASDFEKV